MLEHFSTPTFYRLRIRSVIRMMIPAALAVTLAASSFGQSQSSTSTDDPAASLVAATKTGPANVPASELPISRANPGDKAYSPGAGSSHHGYVEFTTYFFKVNRSGGDPAVINSTAGGLISSIDNFNYGWELAYKGEAGWNASNGFGFRGSYLYTNQTAQVVRTATATAPFIISPRPLNVTFTGAADATTVATFGERFKLQVIDLEGTYKWHAANWSALVSGGVRIALSRQTYTAQDTFAGTKENVSYIQKRTGYGPTGAVDFRHQIGGSSVWWTGTARFAYLTGNITENANYIAGTFSQPTARTSGRKNWVFEGETGVEWLHNVGGGGNELFLNGSFIYHNWNNIVNVMPTSAVGGSATTSLDNPLLPPTKKGSISFVGGSFTVGFRF
jgi:hypothetical protein